jgi:hypothetical protein
VDSLFLPYFGLKLARVAYSFLPFEVATRIITECCPNLRFLDLHRNHLWCFSKSFNEEDLQEVERFKNTNCLCLTNHVFQKTAEFNAFPNLRYFEVISNSRITKESIDILMQGSPSQSDEAFYAAPI